MSSTNSTTSSPYAGIVATKADLAPSIVFVVAFFLLVPIALWRLTSKSSRTTILLRPFLFILVRIGTYIVRGIEANGHTSSTDILAAEFVLLSVGTVLLIEPLVTLLRMLLDACIPYEGQVALGRRRSRRNARVSLLTRVLRIALLAAVAISIYSATRTRTASTDNGVANLVATLRKVTAIILVAVVALCVLGLWFYRTRYSLPSRTFVLLTLIGLALEVTSGYRLASAFGVKGTKTELAFWLASALPEWLVAAAYLSTNLNRLIPQKTAEGEPSSAYLMAQHAHGSTKGRVGSSRPQVDV